MKPKKKVIYIVGEKQYDNWHEARAAQPCRYPDCGCGGTATEQCAASGRMTASVPEPGDLVEVTSFAWNGKRDG